MRAVIQRVAWAKVTVAGEVISSIRSGLLVFVGIEAADSLADLQWLSKKIVNLRIFNDKAGIMNCSLLDTGGDSLIVSQFTLHALTQKGNRPSYSKAAGPEVALPLYEAFVRQIENDLGKPVGTGKFGAAMKVELLNDGPVTLLIDTKNKE